MVGDRANDVVCPHPSLPPQVGEGVYEDVFQLSFLPRLRVNEVNELPPPLAGED